MKQFIAGLIVCAVLGARIAGGAAQAHVALASLTVPENKLPTACTLKPVVERTRTMLSTTGKSDTIRISSGDEFPTNPWIGTDGKFLIDLKTSVDGPLKMPDAPPPSPALVAAINERWTANVVEGYSATYSAASTGLVRVSAIRLADPTQAATPFGASATRLVIGDLIVRVTQVAKSDCFQPIYDYLRSLK